MRIYDIEEHGFHRAMRGLARSYNQDPRLMPEVALKLGPKDLGHNKFLESMAVWMEIDAPRFWWSEFDTYRGDMEDQFRITKQSDSTMHTLKRKPLTQDNFEYPIPNNYIDFLNSRIEQDAAIWLIKNELPDGFIQGRSVCTNYKVIRNILMQRWNHKLPQWRQFCQAMAALEHFKYLGLPAEYTLEKH